VLRDALPEWQEPTTDRRAVGLVPGSLRPELQSVMTERAGVLRSHDGLAEGAAALADLSRRTTAEADVATWETTNLLTVASALLAAAQEREETRGSHWREDHPERDDTAWQRHLDVTMTDGVPRLPEGAPA
jgi:L-aspartate oxidase